MRVGSLSNTYAALPAHFYARLPPTPVAEPRLIRINWPLAQEIGLDLSALDPRMLEAMFSGNTIPENAEPIATAYAGHQFGRFVPQLGDGRAILLAEVLDAQGVRRDIQLKGSGRTPYSRSGDGRAALGPVLREYLVSEAMHALGIPTTRALAAVTTGEMILREGPVPGAVLTRVAVSHVRVGTFEYHAARGDEPAVRNLADYVIKRHYEAAGGDANPYLALLEAVIDRQARLVALWMQVGFIHGVMNTDNMTVSGETIDFGPCAFMDSYDPATVYSAIDRGGRYAYANQPRIAQWNLARFAETLLPLLDPDQAVAVERASDLLSGFSGRYAGRWLTGMRAKLGLRRELPEDLALIEALLAAMHANQADYTLTFRRLCDAVAAPSADAGVRSLFERPAAYDGWAAAWRERLQHESGQPADRSSAMRGVNPAYVPRNHRVEQALRAALERADFTPFNLLLEAVTHPFADDPAFSAYASPPTADERVLRTFCGT